MSNYGFVYILDSEYMPNVIKIGCTERSPHARADELSKPTGVPMPFRVLCYAEFEDFQVMERKMHEWCAQYRINSSREFFHGCLEYAVSLLWFHPRRLAFADATSGNQFPTQSELTMMVCRGKYIDYFDDLMNPFANAAKEVERREARVKLLDSVLNDVPSDEAPKFDIYALAYDEATIGGASD